jgi:hypothetical protein
VKAPRILSVDDLWKLHAKASAARRPHEVEALTREGRGRWTSDTLPHVVGGWRIAAEVSFTDPVGDRFTPEAVATCEGPDVLSVEMLADPPEAERGHRLVDTPTFDGFPQGVLRGNKLAVAGRIAVVGSLSRPILAHVSRIGVVAVHWVTFHPTRKQVAEAHVVRVGAYVEERTWPPGNGQRIPPILLRYLAERDDDVRDVATGHYTVIPSASAVMLPNVPTVGEWKRRKGKRGPDVERITADIMARRRTVGVRVRLDDESMRLASASFVKRPGHRKNEVQLRIPYTSDPVDADDESSMRQAVEQVLAQFDTDYLVTLDAITAVLATLPKGEGLALGDMLKRKVVEMRFGSTNDASKRQRDRVAEHFDTLCKVVVCITPKDGGRTELQGRLIVPVLDHVRLSETPGVAPLKFDEVVMLNPAFYGDIRKGKGLFLDTRYFRFDPFRDDWKMRVYRCLAAHWSFSSAKLERSGDWTLKLRLTDLLDMAGVDWKTKTQARETRAQSRGRGEGEQRRRLEEELSDLSAQGLIGSWRIDGDGMTREAALHVEVAPDMRKAIVGRRPGLHGSAAAGTLAAKPKRTRKRAPNGG